MCAVKESSCFDGPRLRTIFARTTCPQARAAGLRGNVYCEPLHATPAAPDEKALGSCELVIMISISNVSGTTVTLSRYRAYDKFDQAAQNGL